MITLVFSLLLSAGPEAAQERADAAQLRCFCVQRNPAGSPVPYFLARMDWEECRGRAADFTKYRGPFELGLLNCEDLMACLDAPPKEKKAREAAMKKAADVTEALRACCRGDKENCPKACIDKYERELGDAKKKSARLEQKALRRQDACIAAKKPAAKAKEK